VDLKSNFRALDFGFHKTAEPYLPFCLISSLVLRLIFYVFVKYVTIDEFILFYFNDGINDSIRIILLDSKDELIWLWQAVFY
jgi:hypothetical protein